MSMKKLVFLTLFFGTLSATAVLLNPTPEQHRAKIKSEVSQRSPLASLLGLGSLTAFVSTYHSLGVMSYTVVNEKTVSVGAFGMVVVVE